MILTESEAKKLLQKILSYSKAESCIINIYGNDSYNLRFALNSLSTNGFADGLSVSVTSNYGKKSGSISLNNFDESALKEAVKTSEDIAKFSPDNEEFMPPLPPQTYIPSNNFDAQTAGLSSEERANKISYIIDKSSESNLNTAGFFENETSFNAIMNSNGLFAYNEKTSAGFSATVRTPDGTGSSRVQKNYIRIADLNVSELTDKALERSILSKNPIEVKPGKYTVILEPSAAADMIGNLSYFLYSRSADEGRSPFSKKDKKNKIGETVASSKVTIYSDPVDPNAPSVPFDGQGMPVKKTVWIEKGILKNLYRDRYWAKKTGKEVVPYPSNLLMEGSSKSTEELIASTDYGILVTRFWYIRTVDPQTMLLTGLTRDGLFLIENGKITSAVKNFRFNESPLNMLENVIEVGRAEKAAGSETGDAQIFVPPIKTKDFNFSSLSDAI